MSDENQIALTIEDAPTQDLPPDPPPLVSTPVQTSAPSTRDAVTEASRYLAGRRAELLSEVGEIESFLGFANQADDLAVRVAKLERFLGLSK